MRLPRFLRDPRLHVVAGAGVAWSAFACLAWGRRRRYSDAIPEGAAPPPYLPIVFVPGASPAPRGGFMCRDGWMPVSLRSGVVRLIPGARYRAVADIPGPVPTGMVVERAPAKLRELGFVDVRMAADESPSPWPRSLDASDVDDDLYVEATYAGVERDYQVPSQVKLAWIDCSG